MQFPQPEQTPLLMQGFIPTDVTINQKIVDEDVEFLPLRACAPMRWMHRPPRVITKASIMTTLP